MAAAKLKSKIEREGRLIRRWLILDVEAGIRAPEPIYFEFDAEPPDAFDGLVQAVLFWAMAARVDLDVRGPMTRDAVANIDELQTALSRIHGEKYRPVRITPESIDDPTPPPRRSVMSLFSGGVDGVFTLLRHQGGTCGVTALPIKSVLLVHHEGLDRPEIYVDQRLRQARPLLDAMGVDVRVQRTNLRMATDPGVLGKHGQKYNPSFSGQLAGSLNQYGNEFGRGLVGSSEPYDRLDLRVGSNPATDWLLSTGHMRILHDGAGFSRTEKVALIAQHPAARRAIHVCFDHPYENCGKCPKCVRTYMNFLAIGIDRPECMPGRLELSQIDNLPTIGRQARIEFETILEAAAKNGISGPWIARLRNRLRFGGRGTPDVLVRRTARRLKNSIGKRVTTRDASS